MNQYRLCLRVLVLVAALSGYSLDAFACPRTKQQTFEKPEDAAIALGAAASTGDLCKLEQIFGPHSGPLLHSGDPVADRTAVEAFSSLYMAKNTLEKASDNGYALIIGPKEWPFPIPVTSEQGRWRFDTVKGADEILNRRIGRNELWAIGLAKKYVAAQKEYASQDQDGDGYKEYAQVFLSDRGWHNGLFWVRTPGDPVSPLGPVIAQAIAAGYQPGRAGSRVPVHGYYFKILRGQGADAPGGKRSYMSPAGRMTEGFGLLAWPTQWNSSGIMSFIVNQDGVIYQKNLGKNTAQIGERITEYNPDPSWRKAESAE